MMVYLYKFIYNHDQYIFNMIREIIETVKLTQNKVYLSKNMMTRFALKNGDKLVWALNEDKELMLIKANRINKESNYDITIL